VRLASRGLRDMDSGIESITDSVVEDALQRQARRVQWSALLAAAALTVLYLIVS
jgi:hypothetical protein